MTRKSQGIKMRLNHRADYVIDEDIRPIFDEKRVQIQSAAPEDQIEAIKIFHKYLSEELLPIDAVVDAGLIPRFVELLTKGDQQVCMLGSNGQMCMFFLPTMAQELQFEAGSALAKVASSDAGHSALLVQHDAIPVFLGLLQSDDHRMVELSASAIGCIAGDSLSFRDKCLSLGAIPPLVDTLGIFSENIAVARSVTSAIANLCRGHPRPLLRLLSPTVPALAMLLKDHVDESIATNVCDALSKIIQDVDEEEERAGNVEGDRGNNVVETILAMGAAPCLVSLLNTAASLPTLTAVLRLTSQLLSGDEAQTQVMIEAGVIAALGRVLTSGHRKLLREACFSLGNIASTTAHAQAVFEADPPVLPPVVEIMVNEWIAEIRQDAAWAVGNCITHGAWENVLVLVDTTDLLRSLSVLLSEDDDEILALVLSIIHTLLKRAASEGSGSDVERFTAVLRAQNAVAHFQAYPSYSSEEVSKTATALLQEFFTTV